MAKDTKFDWGVFLRPTKLSVKNTLVNADTFAVGFSKDKYGFLVIVRDGRKSIEKWSPNYWEVLPN